MKDKIFRTLLLSLRAIGTAGFIPMRVRRLIVNRICPLNSAPNETFKIKFRNHIIEVDLDDFIDNRIFFFGNYEGTELDLIGFLARQYRCRTAVDVGANSGLHTLEMSMEFEKVISFEPLLSVRKKMLDRLEENDVSNVTVCDFALGLEEGKFDYYTDLNSINKGMGSFDPSHNAAGVAIGSFDVRKGDDVLGAESEIDFIKIDVEGWESEVVLGLAGSIRKFKPILMFELTNSTLERAGFSAMTELLNSQNYEMFKINNARRGHKRASFYLDKVDALRPDIGGSNYVAIAK